MSLSPTPANISYAPQINQDAYHVVWLVKRQAYELVFATPRSRHPVSQAGQPRIHVRFKAQRRSEAFAFQVEDLNHFCEDLLCMMEYVQSERRKLRRSEPA
jgi:hypothetical protein